MYNVLLVNILVVSFLYCDKEFIIFIMFWFNFLLYFFVYLKKVEIKF